MVITTFTVCYIGVDSFGMPSLSVIHVFILLWMAFVYIGYDYSHGMLYCGGDTFGMSSISVIHMFIRIWLRVEFFWNFNQMQSFPR